MESFYIKEGAILGKKASNLLKRPKSLFPYNHAENSEAVSILCWKEQWAKYNRRDFWLQSISKIR